ncbi:MAG: hypothetical protein BZ136_07960 [Methanosphaera sp. rholeuAM74]|nr:MAG: hypothetical protein BZ136_07960 [Methanosphaera sp. rholeuAM74]
MAIGVIGSKTNISNNNIRAVGQSNLTGYSADYLKPQTSGIYLFWGNETSITNNNINVVNGTAMTLDVNQGTFFSNNNLDIDNPVHIRTLHRTTNATITNNNIYNPNPFFDIESGNYVYDNNYPQNMENNDNITQEEENITDINETTENATELNETLDENNTDLNESMDNITDFNETTDVNTTDSNDTAIIEDNDIINDTSKDTPEDYHEVEEVPQHTPKEDVKDENKPIVNGSNEEKQPISTDENKTIIENINNTITPENQKNVEKEDENNTMITENTTKTDEITVKDNATTLPEENVDTIVKDDKTYNDTNSSTQIANDTLIIEDVSVNQTIPTNSSKEVQETNETILDSPGKENEVSESILVTESTKSQNEDNPSQKAVKNLEALKSQSNVGDSQSVFEVVPKNDVETKVESDIYSLVIMLIVGLLSLGVGFHMGAKL